MTPALLVAGAAALVYLPLAPRPPGWVRSVVKTFSVAVLALAAPGLLAVALALCALGDWLLSRPGERAFMGGVGAFAAGHLAYVAFFLAHPVSDPTRLAGPLQLAVLALLALIGLAAAALLWRHAGALRGAVLAYVPVILSMGLAALTLPPALALLPALAFIASDLILACEKFLMPPAHPAHRWTPYAVWLLYWGAQAGFFTAFS